LRFIDRFRRLFVRLLLISDGGFARFVAPPIDCRGRISINHAILHIVTPVALASTATLVDGLARDSAS